MLSHRRRDKFSKIAGMNACPKETEITSFSTTHFATDLILISFNRTTIRQSVVTALFFFAEIETSFLFWKLKTCSNGELCSHNYGGGYFCHNLVQAKFHLARNMTRHTLSS